MVAKRTIGTLLLIAGLIIPTLLPSASALYIYDSSGNRLCGVTEELLGQDYDGDGTPDCEDADDDNDGVTDEYEDIHHTNPSTSDPTKDTDSDNDGIPDGRDLLPKTRDSADKFPIDFSSGTWTVTSPTKCEGALDGHPDPYMVDLFTVVAGGGGGLSIPNNWDDEHDHRDEDTAALPASSSMGPASKWKAPQDYDTWLASGLLTSSGVPQFTLGVKFAEGDNWPNPHDDVIIDGAAVTGVLAVNIGQAAGTITRYATVSADCTARVEWPLEPMGVAFQDVRKAIKVAEGLLAGTGNTGNSILPACRGYDDPACTD